MCIELGMANRKQRADFHAVRKQHAKSVWETGVADAEQPSEIGCEDPSTGSNGLRPGASGDDPEGTRDKPVSDQPAPAVGTLQNDSRGTEAGIQGKDAPDSGVHGDPQDNQLGAVNRGKE